MTQTIALGPLVLSLPLLLGVAALLVAGFAGRRAGRSAGIDVEPHLYRMLFAALLAARLAFVAQFRGDYLREPLGILDIRDGGWNAWAGLAVGVGYLAVLALRRAALRRPLAVAVATGALVWFGGVLALQATTRGEQRLPQLTLAALDGTQVPLAVFTGRPTVVNLWATWCPPCRREMPVLQQAQAERADVHFVFVNQREDAAKVQAYLAGGRLQLRNVLLDSRGDVAAAFAGRALPTTLFFDASGRLVDTRVGELSRASLAERLRAISR